MITIILTYMAIFLVVKMQMRALDKSYSSLTSGSGRTENLKSSENQLPKEKI